MILDKVTRNDNQGNRVQGYIYTGFFWQGGNWIWGDNSERGTVFIYILMFSVLVRL